MQFSAPLHKAHLIKRYKRFLADIKLSDGTIVTAHCPNTGSMESCYETNGVVWVSQNDDPARKLKWTWEFSEMDGGLIGVNTARPNQVVAEAIAGDLVPNLTGYKSVKREVKYGKNSRIDLLLEGPEKKPCYVEIKNTTLKRGEKLQFPDAVTERGLKHLQELSDVIKSQGRAVMLYFINRPDGKFFCPADDIDPKYANGLRNAIKQGVEVVALRANSSTTSISTGSIVDVKI